MICAWAQRRLFLVQFFSVGGCASSYSYLPAQIIRNFPGNHGHVLELIALANTVLEEIFQRRKQLFHVQK